MQKGTYENSLQLLLIVTILLFKNDQAYLMSPTKASQPNPIFQISKTHLLSTKMIKETNLSNHQSENKSKDSHFSIKEIRPEQKASFRQSKRIIANMK